MPATNGIECRVCGEPCAKLWDAPLLDLTVGYLKCSHCGYVQTEQPHWLDRAYARSINDSDTGIMARNLSNSRIVIATLMALGRLHERVVDVAGGYGILTRLLRDSGVDALWSDAFSENLVARGFEHRGESACLVTAFEAFEHFVDPGAELDRLLAIAPNVLLSTEIIPNPAPKPGHWWYYGEDHGQHIGFYEVRTLRFLAARRGKRLLTDGRAVHLLTDRPLSSRVWRLLLRFSGVATRLATRTLKSRTATDFSHMTQRSPRIPEASLESDASLKS